MSTSSQTWVTHAVVDLPHSLFVSFRLDRVPATARNCAPERSTSSSRHSKFLQLAEAILQTGSRKLEDRLNWLNEAALAASPDFAEAHESDFKKRTSTQQCTRQFPTLVSDSERCPARWMPVPAEAVASLESHSIYSVW